MKSKLTFGIITISILAIVSIFLLGFKLKENKTPMEVYGIYLDGKKIGTVKSKDEFDNYINAKEEQLKQKYNVDKIKKSA